MFYMYNLMYLISQITIFKQSFRLFPRNLLYWALCNTLVNIFDQISKIIQLIVYKCFYISLNINNFKKKIEANKNFAYS